MNEANMLWHSDSSFKTVPALCSFLSARIVPPEGGDTEFASARRAYAALPEALKRRVETAIAVYPPVRHPLVRTNPANGEKNPFLGAHASHIEGLAMEEGRAFLKELLDRVTRPEFRYRHASREGDLVVWDNRCVLHRATPFDAARRKRFMQRTTVSGDPGEFALRSRSAALDPGQEA
jgi:alpha-ketoglutarate-dependent 2,4-dichlorophenoxyacetate dioxygenase